MPSQYTHRSDNTWENGGKSSIRLFPKTSDNPKAPVRSGFLTITPEQLRQIAEQEPDEYGSYKFRVSLWIDQKDESLLSGSLELASAKEPEQKPPARTFKEKPRGNTEDIMF
jgi:hypothetical protein